MMRPLPSRTSEIQEKKANLGLYWSKFFNGWPADPATKMEASAKLEWIKEFAKTSPNTSAAAKRMKDMAVKLGGGAHDFVSDAPFVTGTGLPHPVENGFVFHHTLGVPYLPASSIKGMIRAWVLHWNGDETEAFRLFGRNDKHADGQAAGSLIVFDGLPSGEINLMAEILTPHTGEWRISESPAQNPPADWLSPVPIPFLTVAPGAMFQFAFAPRKAKDKKDVEQAFNFLSEALEWIGAGAKTSIGMGRMVKATEQQSAAKSSLKEKDMVAITGGNSNVGRKGTIFKIVPMPGGEPRAQLSALEGEGKLKGNYPLSDLTLVEK